MAVTPNKRATPRHPGTFARKRRTCLRRRWAEGGATCCFVMLNPSTADEITDDPTIRRCIGFARDWGHAALVVVNLYTLRATHPADLFADANRLGPDDDQLLVEHAREADFVLAAWGAHGGKGGRGDEALALLAGAGLTVSALGLTKNGQPRHPLYVGRAARPFVMLERGERVSR